MPSSGQDYLSLDEASRWASALLQKNVTTSNISYLIQYGRVRRHTRRGTVAVSKQELGQYYRSYHKARRNSWRGCDSNWALSFEKVKEAETTKHVHRLHPYKGKFIPQLVAYFLDGHTDRYKQEVYFQRGDTILDPFCGSGTTLVQANELGMHAIGIDISAFNAQISNVKLFTHDLDTLAMTLGALSEQLAIFVASSTVAVFEQELSSELARFNSCYFPSPTFKYRVRRGELNQKVYGHTKVREFLPRYRQLLNKHRVKLQQTASGKSFLANWYLLPIRREIDFLLDAIDKITDKAIRQVLQVIVSRTVRSCRATSHADLGTLKEPITEPYYCMKHGKVCRPLFSLQGWWRRYCNDTLKRLRQFAELRTHTTQVCLTGDARQLDIVAALQRHRSSSIVQQGIQGIFSSPPYVGLIDYHQQHAYAYDMFNFQRRDQLEIGALSRGQGRQARVDYGRGIAQVLRNCRKFLAPDHHIFLVANDRYNLYPDIAEQAGLRIVNRFHRPVLNRTEKDKGAYSETIFHLKAQP